MRVLVAGSYDPACQGYLTAKAMRDYLGWDARSLCTTKTWLDYDCDWLLEDNVTEEEVFEFAKDCDYFIFMDQILSPLQKFLTNKNCCILGAGTALRNNMDTVLIHQIKHGLKVLVPPQDPSMCNNLIGIPFDWVICPVMDILQLTNGVDKYDEFTVCHAPTSFDKKGTEKIQHVVEDLGYAFKIIHGKPWKDALVEKAKCHVLIDEVVSGTYGLNVLEAFAMGQPVFTYYSPWCYMINPDLPGYNVGPELDELDWYLINLSAKETLPNETAYDWVLEHNSEEAVSEKWKYYMDWVKS